MNRSRTDSSLAACDDAGARPEWARVLEADVQQLKADVAALQERQDSLRDAASRTSRKLSNDVTFLGIVAAAVKGSVFSAAELLAHAAVDPDLAHDLDGLTPVHVGRKLRALAGRAIGPYLVERIGRDADGVVWAVRLHEDAGAAVGDGV